MTDHAQLVGDILQEYAERGIFRGFSRAPAKGSYRVLWLRDQLFEWRWNDAKKSLRITCVLPQVAPQSAMYRELRSWLKSRQDAALPDHRRCDAQRVALRPYNRGGSVALTLRSLDGDVEYLVRKMVSLVNELYVDFLSSGLYLDWQIETFNLDPDNPR